MNDYIPENMKWEQLTADVVANIKKLEMAWTASEMALPPADHERFVADAYLPVLLHLAKFCVDVEQVVEIEEDA